MSLTSRALASQHFSKLSDYISKCIPASWHSDLSHNSFHFLATHICFCSFYPSNAKFNILCKFNHNFQHCWLGLHSGDIYFFPFSELVLQGSYPTRKLRKKWDLYTSTPGILPKKFYHSVNIGNIFEKQYWACISTLKALYSNIHGFLMSSVRLSLWIKNSNQELRTVPVWIPPPSSDYIPVFLIRETRK